MSWAVFRVMLLGLIRDRGALAMTFLVPAVFFLVFVQLLLVFLSRFSKSSVQFVGGRGIVVLVLKPDNR